MSGRPDYELPAAIAATFSPIAIAVTFVFARMQSGMTDASATRNPDIP
jgi:hypothetical protein